MSTNPIERQRWRLPSKIFSWKTHKN